MDLISLDKRLRVLPLLFVALTGSLGTIYLLGLNMNSTLDSDELNMSWNDASLLEHDDEYFTTFGIQEVDRTLEFVIHDYNEKTTYEIDFGDGHCKEFSQSNVTHRYTKSGDYNVTLSVVYMEELLVLNDVKIKISSPQP